MTSAQSNDWQRELRGYAETVLIQGIFRIDFAKW